MFLKQDENRINLGQDEINKEINLNDRF